MTTLLESLSNELATAVEAGGRAVVAIHARRRIPASGVHWRQGVIVATNHTINRDENITVTLPDGTTAPATLAGRGLGINRSGLARGTAVAIPVATVERTVGELLERGTIRRAYLGIGTQSVRVPQSLARRLELKNTVGLLIASVEPGGPADRDGVLLGDVLLALDGADVSDPTDVLAQLGGDR